MFCPKCKAEYRDGFFKCAECKVDLVTELPQEPELTESEQYAEYINLVNIETYYDRQEAQFAKGLLSANGIYAVIQGGEDGVFLDQALLSGVKLLVKEKYIEEAKNILNEINKQKGTYIP